LFALLYFRESLLPCFGLLLSCAVLPALSRLFCGDQAVLRGLLAVEDGAAGAADRNPMLDFLRANGTLRERLCIVQPRFLKAELPRGAAFEVGDEHGILGALPFEIGGSDETPLKFFEPAPGVGKLCFRWSRSRRDKHAGQTILEPGIFLSQKAKRIQESDLVTLQPGEKLEFCKLGDPAQFFRIKRPGEYKVALQYKFDPSHYVLPSGSSKAGALKNAVPLDLASNTLKVTLEPLELSL